MKEPESVILIPVPDAEFAVRSLREQYDPVCLRGIPAHITVLYPFYAPHLITPDMIHVLEEMFAAVEPFAFDLAFIRTFPNAVYLEPAPREPFIRLTQAVYTAFPDRPPCSGKFPDVNPHLTIAQVGEDQDRAQIQAEIEESVADLLPIHAQATKAVLSAQDERGHWTVKKSMNFGRTAN